MKNKRCAWCTNINGGTDIRFSVFDDDFGYGIPSKRLKYCPFCGRELQEQKQ